MSAEIQQALSSLSDLPIAVESASGKEGNPLANKMMKKREELAQLKILFTEAQLPKNPLTIQKLISTLPRENSLVKGFYKLKAEYDEYNRKYKILLKRAAEAILELKGNQKANRKEILRHMASKPNITEATDLIEQLDHSRIDFKDQIKRLTEAINGSLEIASSVKRFESNLPDATFQKIKSQDEVSKALRDIDDLRKKVMLNAELNLTDEFNTLYHLEIHNKMRTLLLSQTSDL